MRRIALTIAALLGLGGCAKEDLTQECFRIEDCGKDRICFLGTCQPKGYSIQEVYAELMPPTESGYLRQQILAPIAVADGYQLVTLAPTIGFSGTVAAPDTTYAGVLAATRRDALPKLEVIHRATVQASGTFVLQVTPGDYDLVFTPYPATEDDPLLPPLSYGEVSLFGESEVTLAYPAAGELLFVCGRVLYESAGAAVAEAAVKASAVSVDGAAVFSSEGKTNAAGEFTLAFPPAVSLASVEVKLAGGAAVPEAAVVVTENTEEPRCLQDIVLGVMATEISGHVVGSDDAVVPGASVFMKAEEIGALAGAHAARADSDDLGGFAVTVLSPATYEVTVVPSKNSPYAISTTWVTVTEPQGAPLSLSVGRKVLVEGTVRTHEGTEVVGAKIFFKLRNAPIARVYEVETLASGSYAIAVDRGEYEVSVEAAAGTPLPSHRIFRVIDGNDPALDIRLYSPDFVYGSIVAPDGSPIGGVGVTLYATELIADRAPLVIGVGVSGQRGEFIIPIPRPDDN